MVNNNAWLGCIMTMYECCGDENNWFPLINYWLLGLMKNATLINHNRQNKCSHQAWGPVSGLLTPSQASIGYTHGQALADWIIAKKCRSSVMLKISRLPVLPLEVQVIYMSSTFLMTYTVHHNGLLWKPLCFPTSLLPHPDSSRDRSRLQLWPWRMVVKVRVGRHPVMDCTQMG